MYTASTCSKSISLISQSTSLFRLYSLGRLCGALAKLPFGTSVASSSLTTSHSASCWCRPWDAALEFLPTTGKTLTVFPAPGLGLAWAGPDCCGHLGEGTRRWKISFQLSLCLPLLLWISAFQIKNWKVNYTLYRWSMCLFLTRQPFKKKKKQFM